MDKVDNTLIQYDLKKEAFFSDPMTEYKYFKERIEAIDKYSNDFFQEQAYAGLTRRYIKAIACMEDDYEYSGLVSVYRDCLEELGCDSYIMDQEVENYKATHDMKKEKIVISETGKGHK